MPEMSLQDAVRKVLAEAEEPLYYKEIASIIAAEGLRENMGATPDKTVAAALSVMRKNGEQIDVPRRGYYVNRPTIAPSPSAPILVEDEEDEEYADSTAVRVAAYGLYWEREKVEWDLARGQKIELLGRPYTAPEPVINFADQQGIYLLHQMQSVTYVGRTSAESNGLLGRLKSHTTNPRRSGRWDRFSWFGLRPVSEEGELLGVPEALTSDQLITILEAVLIETYLPAFNDKRGDDMGQLYEQVIDPEIAASKANELLRDALRR